MGLALMACACNLQGPQVTLTLAPISTRPPQATDIVELPTATAIKQDLPTITATDAPSPAATETATPSPAPQPTATDTPSPGSATPTRIRPRTATPTAAASASPAPDLDAATRSAASPTAQPSEEPPPTFTALPTLDALDLEQLLATPTPRATWTAVPTLPPTALAVTAPAENTPARPRLAAETLTPSPTPTRFQPTVAVRRDLLLPTIDPPVFQPASFNIIGVGVYEYDVGPGQNFSFKGLQVGGGVALFAPNPAAAGSFLRTDQVGLLHYKPIGAAAEAPMIYSPFHPGFSAASSEGNKNRVVEIDWSADGRQFTFRIDPPAGQDNSNAGVWLWQPETSSATDPTYAVIRDCAAPGYRSCEIVVPSNARHWRTIDVAWSPVRGSSDILLRLHLPDENRSALARAQAVRDAKYADNAPAFARYDYGHWNTDGGGIIVSGRGPDNRVIIAELDRDLGHPRLLLDASARGLWMQDAVRRPDGGVVALGRTGGPGQDAPVALYDSAGRRLSDFIGTSAPSAVRWYPDRSAAAVTVGGRQYTVHVDSRSLRDTTDLTRNPSFGAGGVGAAPLPQAVVRGSEYLPGQQLRSLRNLNVRAEPSTAAAIVGGLFVGDYLAILAGPYESEGYRWWRVQTADNVFGWVAGVIGGRPSIAPG